MSVISRSTWGARRPDGFADRPLPVREFWLHHSVTSAPANSTSAERAAMRQLEDIGHASFGGGISYTYVLPPSGRIYEGHSLHRRGAHTGGHNTVSAAFSLMGNYDAGDRVTDAQMNAIARQMVALHKAGKATRHTLNGGHRDTGFATACPGRHAYPLISEINRRANALWAGGKIPSGSGGAQSAPAPKPAAKPKPSTSKAPKFPLPAGHWYGVESSNPKNHSGYYAKDRAGIKQWQAQMKKRGWKITVDGRFGKQSASVALAFQKEKRLSVDGAVGASTWAASWSKPVT